MQRFEDDDGVLMALLFTGDFYEGTNFFTKDEDDMQVGTWVYPKGTMLNAHYHEHNPRIINKTREFVYCVEGCILVELYDEQGDVMWRFHIRKGQFAIMFEGGHGYEMTEDSKVIEVKAGEFNYDDKVRI